MKTLFLLLFSILISLNSYAAEADSETLIAHGYVSSLPECEGGQDSYRTDCVGTYKWQNGWEYFGEFQNGMRHGVGIFNFKDPDAEYFGEIINDAFSGSGIRTYPDGAVWAGEFKNDQVNGLGVYVEDDFIEQGIYSDDNFQSVKKYLPKNASKKDTYSGSFLTNGWTCNPGYQKFKNYICLKSNSQTSTSSENISIPANAYASGATWTCDEGYIQIGNSCDNTAALEKQKLDQERLEEEKRIADAKKAEEAEAERQRIADAKKAEEAEAERQRIADAKKVDTEKKALERKRLTDAKKVKEEGVQRVADAKQARADARRTKEEGVQTLIEPKKVSEIEKIIADAKKTEETPIADSKAELERKRVIKEIDRRKRLAAARKAKEVPITAAEKAINARVTEILAKSQTEFDAKAAEETTTPNFNKGKKLWWRLQGGGGNAQYYVTYLAELGLPTNERSDILLIAYFRYMMLRDWETRNLISSFELDSIKELTKAISDSYQNNSTFSTDSIWDVASKLFDWKYDFIGSIDSSDFTFVRNMLERQYSDLYKYARLYGLVESSTVNDL